MRYQTIILLVRASEKPCRVSERKNHFTPLPPPPPPCPPLNIAENVPSLSSHINKQGNVIHGMLLTYHVAVHIY